MTVAGRVAVSGVVFDAVTEVDVVANVMARLEQGRGTLIITPNVDILRQLRRPEHADIVRRADLVVADGMPIVWASRLQGEPLPERVTGSSLVWSLSRGAAAHGRTVFLLGARPNIARTAAVVLGRRVPGLQVVGTCSPEPGFDQSAAAFEDMVQALARADPDIVFCAFGFPKQERSMLRLADRFPGACFLGCGGSLDLVAGATRRAPVVVQRMGLEWMFRLVQEPRRLGRRYLVDSLPHAVRLLVLSWIGRVRHQ